MLTQTLALSVRFHSPLICVLNYCVMEEVVPWTFVPLLEVRVDRFCSKGPAVLVLPKSGGRHGVFAAVIGQCYRC